MKITRFGKSFQRLVLAVLIPAFATVGGPLGANPSGPSGADVAAGNVTFSGLGTPTLDINNFSTHAIINWQSFSIQQGELTRVNQAANAATLNRVVTGAPSEIHGRLEASNGSVFLLNPNGILVGAGGVVDVAGMAVLSTLDVADADFRDGGESRFFGGTQTGVSNFGTISSAGGDVVLMGGFVENKGDGQIGALNGTVAIGSSGDILLHEGGGTRISVRGESDYTGTGIDNTGEIRGASVEMKSHGNVYALAINNGGAVRATGANRSNGRVRLTASGGSSNINLGASSAIVARAGNDGGSVEVNAGQGDVQIGGHTTVAGEGEGGTVEIAGRNVTQSSASAVDASGGQSGGSVALDAVETMTISGTVDASGGANGGGDVAVTARTIVINDGAHISADGMGDGGEIRIGGDFQGQDTGLREADSVQVGAGARLSADSLEGDAGTVIVWANQDTIFLGDVSAKAKGAAGNGGIVEVSGKEFLYFDGSVDVSAIGGNSGMVLFDPGNVIIGATVPGGELPILGSIVTGIGGPPTSLVSIEAINNTLQSGAHVLVVTHSGSIFFNPVAGGGDVISAVGHDRHAAIQWTNSESSFGAFASDSIVVNNHIRTSGAGSISLLAGWGGSETDAYLVGPGSTWDGNPQSAWDHYVALGQFGANEGSVLIGSPGMFQHVEVGSRFGDTNVAGFDVTVAGSFTNATLRYAQLGWHDGGQAFAPRLNLGGNLRLDLIQNSDGTWYLSDGKNTGGAAGANAAGVFDPIVAVAGNAYGQEVDINGDGIIDGVYGINSTGLLEDTFIPYANHYNSVSSGNWWWQQIEAAGALDPSHSLYQKADPLGLGALRPEHGAGIGEFSSVALATLEAAELSGVDLSGYEFNGANINVIAKRDVLVQGGAGLEGTGAMIGHGGINRLFANGLGASFRNTANDNVALATFSNQAVEGGQVERRWSFNGTMAGSNGTAIGRLAPVYGNITVLAGVEAAAFDDPNNPGVRANSPMSTTFGTVGDVMVRANQNLKLTAPSSHSPAHIGHGGAGQAGEFFGDIRVEAAGNISVLAGDATGSFAAIGHTITEGAFWNLSTNADQQLRFFATVGDMDNPNLRRGELFSGNVTTGFDPTLDPVAQKRYTLAGYTLNFTPGEGGDPDTYSLSDIDGSLGNFVPEIVDGQLTGNFISVNHDEFEDAYVIPMNPLLYTRGTTGPGVHAQGLNSLAPLTLSLVTEDSIPIAALDGSMLNGLHGNVKVVARSGDLLLKAFSTVGVNQSLAREHRFAVIGHGGRSNLFAGQGAGYQNLLGEVPVVPETGDALIPDGREIVNYHTAGAVGTTPGNGDTSGARSHYGASGASLSRRQSFMTISGDIDVSAGRDITLLAGNDIYDYTRIGHGGVNLADYETSSLILGDIRVAAVRDITVTGGGLIQPINRGSTATSAAGANLRNYDLQAWSQIGHGGFTSGFYGFLGDIDVRAGRDILLQGGAHSLSFAKIGHQGATDRGQSGGSMIRDENFRMDGANSDIETRVTADGAIVIYSPRDDNDHPGSVSASRVLTAGTLVANSRNTADVYVEAGGSVTLEHLPMGERQPQARLDWLGVVDPSNANFNPNSQAQGVRTRNSYVQIGHGGLTTIASNANNLASNYGDKIGNITVIAKDGNIELRNGEGEHRWTRIGHGVGRSERINDNNANWGYSRATELAGDITIRALSGDVRIDAAAADEDESALPGNTRSAFGSTPSRFNPVAIGHGGVDNNLSVVVLGRGEDVNGISASSNILLEAEGSLYVLAGGGVAASFAQLGHGFASDDGQEHTLRRNVHTGFAGNIEVSVAGDILVKAGDNAWTEVPDSISGIAASVHGALAVIGHGGFLLDAPSFGNISLYAGGNLSVIGQVRTDGFTKTPGSSLYVYQNPAIGSEAVASVYNFAKIGHFSAENGNIIRTNNNDAVNNVNQTGDILVVVDGDIRVEGGRIVQEFDEEGNPIRDDIDQELTFRDSRTIYGSFAQIGLGGPGISGVLTGNITVLAKGDISVIQGVTPGIVGVDSLPGTTPFNNYAMIGNGDFTRVTLPVSTFSLFRRGAVGARSGNIVVAAGEDIFLDGALIGHADPALSTVATAGHLQVAASRNSPYYGGTGTISAINGTVFRSGGVGYRLEMYVPTRSNNLIDGTTRINEASATFVTPPGDFEDEPGPDGKPFQPEDGIVAGRADEVYLTPDLWWDNVGLAAAALWPGGAPFLTREDAFDGGQGGSIMLVDSPGGIPNLTALVDGALGSSAPLYRNANGVSGAGRYTFYYDAIEFVTNVFPPPPAPPFDWSLLNSKFEVFDRENRFLRDGLTGEGDDLYGSLEYSDDESDDESDGEKRRKAKRRAAKGGPIGLTYYIFEPGTNEYSSYRVYGRPASTVEPIQ